MDDKPQSRMIARVDNETRALLTGAHYLPDVTPGALQELVVHKKAKKPEGANPLEKRPGENRKQFRARKYGYKKPLNHQEHRELHLLERQKRLTDLPPTTLWRLAELRLREKR